MHLLFQALRDELAAARDHAFVTRNDQLHQDNVAAGRDKYHTLKQIAEGNTKKMMALFEELVTYDLFSF